MEDEMIERVAKAICKSKTFEGFQCCQHPANMGRRHKCPVTAGNYDDAAKDAIEAMREPTEKMLFAADWLENGTLDAWRAMIDAALSTSESEKK